MSQAPPDIILDLCEYQPEFNRSSYIDRVFLPEIFIVTFRIFRCLFSYGDLRRIKKYNWNRYSHSSVINGVTNTVRDFLLYIQYTYSLRVLWISTRMKSIMFFPEIFSWLRIFKCSFSYGDLRRIKKYHSNRHSRSWIINIITNTLCDFLLYIGRYSLRVMWILTRVKSIVFFPEIFSILFEFF